MNNKWLLIAMLFAILVIFVQVLRKCSPQSAIVGAKDQLNADGIRSDVAEFIDTTYSNSEKSRAAAKQIARNFQRAIDDPDNALAISGEDDKAMSCTQAIFHGDASEASKLALEIETAVVNSHERSKAYIRYNSNLSGQIIADPPDDISQCEFDPSQMKD